MGIIKDFETDLGTDPEPLHRRLLRAGVRPTELAEAIQEYLQDEQQVTDDGVLVPNVFRITLGTKDHERLARYGVALPRGLGTVVVETAEQRGWLLLGPVKIRVDRDELVKPGAFRLVGRTEPVEGWGPGPEELLAPEVAEHSATVAEDDGHGIHLPVGALGTSALTPSQATGEIGGLTDPTLEVRTGVDAGERLTLDGRRVTAGRGNGCDLIVRDTTVSREHAAFVRRGDTWWVLDLGSTNGTRVNGLRAAEHPIAVGDRIELGDVVVELVEA